MLPMVASQVVPDHRERAAEGVYASRGDRRPSRAKFRAKIADFKYAFLVTEAKGRWNK